MDSNIQIKEFVSESTNIKSIITANDRKFDAVGSIKQLNATENKTYSEDGVAYSPVVVNVPVDASELSVTENGEYTPQTGKYYSKVTVNVPGGQSAPSWFTDGKNSIIPDFEDYANNITYVPSNGSYDGVYGNTISGDGTKTFEEVLKEIGSISQSNIVSVEYFGTLPAGYGLYGDDSKSIEIYIVNIESE